MVFLTCARNWSPTAPSMMRWSNDRVKNAQEVWNEQAGKLYSKDDLDKVIKYRDEFRAKKTATP